MKSLPTVLLSRDQYDVYNLGELRHELMLLQPGTNVIDCRNVRYLDTTALSLLIHTLKALRDRDAGSTITLLKVTPLVRRIFTITRLDNLFTVQ
jgi:anti-anti-sigma factor